MRMILAIITLVFTVPAMADCPPLFLTPTAQNLAPKIIQEIKLERRIEELTRLDLPLPLKGPMLMFSIESKLRAALGITDRGPDGKQLAQAINDQTFVACFPAFVELLALANELFAKAEEDRRQKTLDQEVELTKPRTRLLAAYQMYVRVQKCTSLRDEFGTLIIEPDVQLAKEAVRRAQEQLAPRLDAGVTADEIWQEAIAENLPPQISRQNCQYWLLQLTNQYPPARAIQRP